MTAITRSGSIRKLWVADTAAFRDHLLRLDPQTRRNRFGMAASDEFIRRYAETSFALDTLIHGIFVGDRLVGVGELRSLGRSRTEAEAAFSVETDWQGRGFVERAKSNGRARKIEWQQLRRMFVGRKAARQGHVANLSLVASAGDRPCVAPSYLPRS